MIVNFVLPCKAFSINAYYSRDKRFKSKAGREWDEEFLYRIENSGVQADLQELGQKFHTGDYAFELTILLTYPRNVFFNKQGKISAKTYDISNTEKLIIDHLFMRPENINVDDRFIVSCASSKAVGSAYSTEISIKLVDAPK